MVCAGRVFLDLGFPCDPGVRESEPRRAVAAARSRSMHKAIDAESHPLVGQQANMPVHPKGHFSSHPEPALRLALPVAFLRMSTAYQTFPSSMEIRKEPTPPSRSKMDTCGGSAVHGSPHQCWGGGILTNLFLFWRQQRHGRPQPGAERKLVGDT